LRVARNLADAAFEAFARVAAAAQVAAAVLVAACPPELEQIAIVPLQPRPLGGKARDIVFRRYGARRADRACHRHSPVVAHAIRSLDADAREASAVMPSNDAFSSSPPDSIRRSMVTCG
jgi:hypothetical protein